ncbi:hypothetical protein EH223_04330 [candidate division KSB1 bacterium]|nr:hypothetical protein [candidate division KSB1 bacterium]RQW05511.1 MAG: hypothetical protein EH223_04330 [candidate division KSB1 bacterium]
MLSIKNIWTVTRYEVKTLLRSWFFRIFSGLVLVLLTFFNIVFFAQAFETMPWELRGIPSSIPYFNMMLLNVAQAIIAMFLASDFLKRDRKSNTTEVIYMRSMSNGDYILGKTFGLFNVFLGLNLTMLVISALVHIIFTDVQFQPAVYLYYLLLISFPTLVFIFGLSFFVMSLVRNQAVTFILLLGYFAISLIVLNVKFAGTFDAVAFFLPLSYSDFVGFSDFSWLLIQRLAYLTLGLGFIFLSILLFKRLPQSRTMQGLATVLSVALLITGGLLFTFYFLHARSGDKLRAEMIKLNDQYADRPVVSVSHYDLDFEQQDYHFSMDARMVIHNETNEHMSSLLFSLNPGLAVKGVQFNGQSVNYSRDIHLLQIEAQLAENEEGELLIHYNGSIDNRAFYLTTPKEIRNQLHDLMLYKRGKEHYFVEPNYTLLTSGANWYPIAGTSQGSTLTVPRQKNFARYTLKVKAKDGLVPVSQGQMNQEGALYTFSPEVPLTQISLAIGPYIKRSITVDSVTYNLFTHAAHDFFLKPIPQVADTLAPMIRELKNEYELKTNVDYPFAFFSLVEVPIHFQTYEKPLFFHQDWVQPMMVFMPENGAPIDGIDFKRHMDRSVDRMQDRNETISEKEMQYQVVRRFIESELFGTMPGRFFGRGRQSEVKLYAIFPNFYYFCNALVSRDLPILDATLEAFLKEKVEATAFNPARFMDAITDEEKANIALKDSSLAEILADPENIDIATTVLKTKSSYLFRLLESQVGTEKLEEFLSNVLGRYQFKPLQISEFVSDIQKELGIDFQGELKKWYEQNDVPGFYFTNIKNYKIFEGDRTRYQVLMNIYNPEAVDGVVVIDFMVPRGGGPGGGFGRFNFGASDYEQVVHIEAGQTKQVGFVLDDQPRGLTINTLVSRNLPSQSTRRLEDFEENKSAKAIDGVTILTEPPILQAVGEILVDNEDEGFKVATARQQSALKRILKVKSDDDEEYMPFSPWRAPDNWRKSINAIFYGDFVHSAHFVRAGSGDKKVAWEAELAEAGQYEVYVYGEQLPFRGRGRDGRGGDFIKSFHYIVHHDDGAEDVEWDPESAAGWNYLGTYYFSSGTAKVEMTNKSDGRIVVADAVKWVKK